MIFDAEAADLEAFPPPPETRLRASVRRCRGSGRCRSSAAGLGVVALTNVSAAKNLMRAKAKLKTLEDHAPAA